MRVLKKSTAFWLIILPDWLLFYASLFLTISVRYPHGLSAPELRIHLASFTVIYLLWLVMFYAHNLFELKTFRRYTSLFFSLVSATFFNFLIAAAYFYFQPVLAITPRRFLLLNVFFAFALTLIWHLLVKTYLRSRFVENIFLFSFSGELKDLEREINNHSFLGFRVSGHLSESDLGKYNFEFPASIILPDELQSRPETSRLLFEMRRRGIGFYNHRDFYEMLLRRVYLSGINELWFLENISYKQKPLYLFVKRIIDLMVGLVMGVLFLVTFPLFWMILKLGQGGRVFFVQERVGLGGKLFKVYKYRTMKNGPENTWTAVNDHRITPIGKILRKTHLDELPQFINLLSGNMSLVGPRPEQPHIAKDLALQIPFFDERHFIKPGLTGWSQLNVYAGSVEETKQKLMYDLYYIKHASLLFDFEIILKTLYNILALAGR